MITGMTPVADRALRVLRRSRLDLGPGLSEKEIRDIQAAYGFTFHCDHAAVLRQATPEGWIDWLGDSGRVREALAWPVEGVLFDVERGFWMPAWGERPASKSAAEEVARHHLEKVPTLVPIYGHRYIPAAPERPGAPVFSVYQTDVIHYGVDLTDYCANEFLGVATGRTHYRPVPFWTDIVEGVGGTQFW